MKRNKNESPSPIHVAAKIEEFAWDLLPANLYTAIKDTLTTDWLAFQPAGSDVQTGYYLPARLLLDLARLWKDEPYSIRIELDAPACSLIIKSGQTPAGRFTSKTTLKLQPIEPGCAPFGDQRPSFCSWRDRFTFIPFTLGEAPAAPAAPKYDPWLWKAVSKDGGDGRPALRYPWGDFAADGYRAHFDRTQPRRDFADLDEYTRPSPDALEHYGQGVERLRTQAQDYETLVLIDTHALARAAKLAKSANKETIRLYANGRLDVSARSEAEADNHIGLGAADGYSKAGPDVAVLINPCYLLDALSGLADEVLIAIPNHPDQGIYFTDGTREALIMLKKE